MALTEEREFPNARWDNLEIAKIVRDLMQRFFARDQRLRLRDALIFRRSWDEKKTGQYVPEPFNRSPSIIKHASGILIDRAQFLASKAAENSPNIQVNVKARPNQDPSGLAHRRATEQENAQNAIYWEADQDYETPMQQVMAFSAITKGVGWYLSYENSIGWNLPSRAFYADLSKEEIDRLGGAEAVTDVFPGKGEEFQYAESLDLFERRKLDAMRENATDGASLFVIEPLPPGVVYYRKDTRGISLGAVVEEVPKWNMEDEFGVVEDEHGNLVIGMDRGGQHGVQSADEQRTWLRIRLFTRDEIYYVISKHEGGRPSGDGVIVFHTKHDMGEVPLFPAAANQTDSPLAEEEFIPLLEGAYAMVPGFNQVATLLSNAAIFNTTPRYVILRHDGSPVIDPDTNEPLIVETENTAGLDPQVASVIETGGGQFQQLKIENVDDLTGLLEVWGRAIDQTLPPEAAMGASGSEEPAWGTRLKQAAANVKLIPVVTNHPRAVRKMARMHARVIRHRKQKVIVYSKPARRGRIGNVRAEIELDPDNVSLDISVRQDKADAQEKIVRTQIGTELYMAETPVIGPITFYEEFMGADDPVAAFQEAQTWQLVRMVWQTVSMPRIIARVQGRLAELTPNEEQATAVEASRPDVLPANPAAAAGVRQPGIEQGMTQDTPPVLQGSGAAPLNGNFPV
tara:strand:+ start:1419 stop:3470 length:2052 start_codon:yes stop_codon:yes gene_type:complete